MGKYRPVGIGLVIISIAAIAVVVVSNYMPQGLTPATPTLTLTSVPSVTPTTDPCDKANIAATVKAFDQLSRQFNDAFVLAQATAASQLAPGIAQLQAIRRAAQDYDVPSCLDTLKGYQLGFMNSAIDACLTLYSSFAGAQATMTPELIQSRILAVKQSLAQAVDYNNKYTGEMGRLLGLPTPTWTPSMLETPSGTGTPGTPSTP